MVKIQDGTDISAAGAVADPITEVQGAAAAGAQVEAQRHTEEEPESTSSVAARRSSPPNPAPKVCHSPSLFCSLSL